MLLLLFCIESTVIFIGRAFIAFVGGVESCPLESCPRESNESDRIYFIVVDRHNVDFGHIGITHSK
jgi:hypothetical protein